MIPDLEKGKIRSWPLDLGYVTGSVDLGGWIRGSPYRIRIRLETDPFYKRFLR
jgi:hypothetical protein